MKTIKIKRTGYGQYNVSTEHYGQLISAHCTDSNSVDIILRGERGYLTAIKRMRTFIINRNKLK